MPLVYRGMLPAVGVAGPLVADNDANALGVRVEVFGPKATPDVVTYLEDERPWVDPTNKGDPQGISVAGQSGCDLPPHRRPKGDPWKGTGRVGLVVWQLDTSTLVPVQLAAVPAPLPGQPQHAVIAPGTQMPLANYRGYIAATAGNWDRAPAPAAPCSLPESPVVTVTEGAAHVEPHIDRLADSVISGAEPAELITALLEANGRGVSAAALVAGLEAAVQRAEAGGNDDGAEAVRGVLDRITGYCAPSVRIQLH